MNNLYKVCAFTKDGQGGNKAGVYINANHLTDIEMQNIAKEVGYSETAFVLDSDVADFKVRFFTPIAEVNLCGHATIATFYTLKYLNIITSGMYSQETKAGILKIRVTDHEIHMQQNNPTFYNKVDKAFIKTCFDGIDFNDDFESYVVSTGIKEIFVAVKDRYILDHLIPHIEEIKKVSLLNDTIGIHVFALSDDIDAYGRNFAPVVGIDEESATGTSNGALACYLNRFNVKKDNYIFGQGYSMGLPSEIKVSLEQDDISIESVWIGGKAVLI